MEGLYRCRDHSGLPFGLGGPCRRGFWFTVCGYLVFQPLFIPWKCPVLVYRVYQAGHSGCPQFPLPFVPLVKGVVCRMMVVKIALHVREQPDKYGIASL